MTSAYPTHQHPVLLFPLRLETRYDGSDLLLRIYPDDILVHAHDERVSAAESQALHEYVDAVRKPDAEKAAAWRGLVARVGRTRAAYLIGFETALAQYLAAADPPDGEGDEVEARRVLIENVGQPRADELLGITTSIAGNAREEQKSAVPRAVSLPDELAAYLYEKGGTGVREVRWAVNLPDGGLPLLADPETEEEGASLFADQAAWIGDFAAAERLGMAVRITGALDRYSRLLVIGLKGGDARQGGEALMSLLETHRFSSGVSLVPYGTPTNNTAEGPSGYADDEDDAEGSYGVECDPPRIDPSARTLAGALAWALGQNPDAFEHLAHAAEPVNPVAEELRTLLWPALGGYFLKHMLADPLGSDAAASPWLWNHFREFVDARGPLPAIRVGKQPYGIVPVTGIREWRPASPDAGYDAQFDRNLHQILELLFERWLNIVETQPDLVPRIGRPVDDPDPDQELLEVLAMQPTSVEVHLRPMVDDRFMGSIFPRPHWDYLAGGATSVPTGPEPGAGIGRDPAPTVGGSGGDSPAPMGPLSAEDYIRSTTLATEHRTLDACAAWWCAQYREAHRDTEELLEDLEDLKPTSAKLSEARLLDVYDWSGDNPASDDTAIPLVADPDSPSENPLAYLLQFQSKNDTPGQNATSPLLYDLLRRSRLYAKSPFAGGEASPNAALFDGALSTLAESSVIDLEAAVRDVLDLHTHRLDAWITSLATRRLLGMRLTGTGSSASGIGIGAYGWVEDLERANRFSQDKSGGYIHAPSCGQAAAAAVLRNAYLSHADDEDGNAYRINLSSERVRRAWRVVYGIQEGQELGALLGYQFERGLHDTGNDRCIDEFRRLYPLTGQGAEESPSVGSMESVAPRNVVDGLSLARDWIMYHDEVEDTDDPIETEKLRAAQDAKEEGLRKKWEPEGLVGILDPSGNAAVRNQLQRLSDTMDAVYDLLMYESVYQQVQGNYERSAAALDAMEGECLPPEPESIQTPLAGAAFTQRVCVLLESAGDDVPAARDDEEGPPETPRSMAEPTLARWFGRLLGDLNDIGCLARVITYRDADFEAYEPLDLNAATAEELAVLSPLGEARAQAIVTDRAANGPFPDVMALTRVPVVEADVVRGLAGAVAVSASQVVRLSDLDIAPIDLPYLCESLPEGLLSSLGFQEPTDEDRRAGETELEALIKYCVRKRNLLGPNCEIVIDFAPRKGPFSRSFAGAIELSRSVLGLFGGARPLRPSSMQPPAEQVGAWQYRVEDCVNLRGRVDQARARLRGLWDLANANGKSLTPDQCLELSLYGLRGAIPVSPLDGNGRVPLTAAMEREIGRRLTECERHLKDSQAPADASDVCQREVDGVIDSCLKSMKALFGKDFVALPTMKAPNLEGFFHEPSLLIEDEQRIHLWLQQVAQTHPAVFKLEDAMLAADAWQTPAVMEDSDWDALAEQFPALAHQRLRVAQLSDSEIPYWLALSDAEIEARLPEEKLQEVRDEMKEHGWPNGALSLACWIPHPVDFRRDNISVAGVVIDEWNELIPSAKRITGVSFQYDGPNAQAPQALLLAVPSKPRYHGVRWSLEELREIVNDTLDLAKVRAVDVDALEETIGGVFPANIIPTRDDPDWDREGTPGLYEAVQAKLEKVLTGAIDIQVVGVTPKPLGGHTRAPLAGANVEVDGVGGARQSAVTDANGQAGFAEVPIGNRSVTVRHQDYRDPSPREVDLAFGGIETLRFELTRLQGKVTGVVRALRASDQQSEPLADATVTLTSVSTRTAKSTRSKAPDGSFEFTNLTPDRYSITASYMGNGRCDCTPFSVDVAGGREAVFKELELDCRTSTVWGTVVVASHMEGQPIPLGTPRANVRVTLGTQTAITGNDGRYEIRHVPEGRHTVTAQSDLPFCEPRTREVVVSERGDIVECNLAIICTWNTGFSRRH